MSEQFRDKHSTLIERPLYCCFQYGSNIDVRNLKKRRVIIDGANLLYMAKNSIPGASLPSGSYDSLILLLFIYYFDFNGFHVQTSLRLDFLNTCSNSGVLHELIALGYVFISSNNHREDDDRAALEQAYQTGAVIITNDKFRNHHGYGFSVKSNLCPVNVDNLNRRREEWPHFTFMKPLEHFYFINPLMDVCLRRAILEDTKHPQDPVNSLKLGNLFRFVCAVGWFQLNGEWSNTLPKIAYQVPIDCHFITSLKAYGQTRMFFPPNMVDTSIAVFSEHYY